MKSNYYYSYGSPAKRRWGGERTGWDVVSTIAVVVADKRVGMAEREREPVVSTITVEAADKQNRKLGGQAEEEEAVVSTITVNASQKVRSWWTVTQRKELVASSSQNESEFTEPRMSLYRGKRRIETLCVTKNRSRSREKIEAVEMS